MSDLRRNVESETENHGVGGSIPPLGTTNFPVIRRNPPFFSYNTGRLGAE